MQLSAPIGLLFSEKEAPATRQLTPETVSFEHGRLALALARSL